jgi:hypothetical protein
MLIVTLVQSVRSNFHRVGYNKKKEYYRGLLLIFTTLRDYHYDYHFVNNKILTAAKCTYIAILLGTR